VTRSMASQAWKALVNHQKELQEIKFLDLFAENPNRFHEMSCEAAGIVLDFSKNIATPKTLDLLIKLAEEHQLPNSNPTIRPTRSV